MKIAVVGGGSIGQRHVRNLLLLGEELGISEVACFDTNPERRAQVSEELPKAVVVDSLAAAVVGAEAVFVCVPTSLHVPVIEDIERHGEFHLFIEKPFSHKLDGCEDLLVRQAARGRVTVVGYMLQKHPVLTRGKAILESGALGRVITARAESGFYLPFWHPWEDYRDFYMSWKHGGGGALLDTSHEINYMQWLFGPIRDVTGVFGVYSDLEISSDDLVVFHCNFANGVLGEVHLDLLQFDEERYCKVVGTDGVLVMDLARGEVRQFSKGSKDWTVEAIDVDFDAIYHAETRDFFAACAGKDVAVVKGQEAYATIMVVEAVRRSSSLGATVRLPLYS